MTVGIPLLGLFTQLFQIVDSVGNEYGIRFDESGKLEIAFVRECTILGFISCGVSNGGFAGLFETDEQ